MHTVQNAMLQCSVWMGNRHTYGLYGCKDRVKDKTYGTAQGSTQIGQQTTTNHIHNLPLSRRERGVCMCVCVCVCVCGWRAVCECVCWVACGMCVFGGVRGVYECVCVCVYEFV